MAIIKFAYASIFGCSLMAALPAGAEPTTNSTSATNVPLWSTLVAGDTPQAVAEKIAAMPDIKAVKLKQKVDAQGEAMSISYKDAGIVVLDEKLVLKPIFKSGILSEVVLGEVGTCANTMAERYIRLRSVLSEKYSAGTLSPEVASESLFTSKRLDATPQAPTEYREILSNEGVAVVVYIRFTRVDRPAAVYGADALTSALSSINQSVFNAKASACGGTGRYRADFGLRYITLDTFKAEASQIADNLKQGNAAAAGRL